MHKRAVSCEMCGQQFFPSSLPFHQKQCIVKQQFMEIPCPFCDAAVKSWQMGQHISRECKKARDNKLSEKTKKTTNSVVAASPNVLSSIGPPSCSVCGRRFSSGERLIKHQAICRKSETSKKILNKDPNKLNKQKVLENKRPESAKPLAESKWRERRDEMKHFIKEQRSKANEVSFEIVLKPRAIDEEEQATKDVLSEADSLNVDGNVHYEQTPYISSTNITVDHLGSSILSTSSHTFCGIPAPTLWETDSLEDTENNYPSTSPTDVFSLSSSPNNNENDSLNSSEGNFLISNVSYFAPRRKKQETISPNRKLQQSN